MAAINTDKTFLKNRTPWNGSSTRRNCRHFDSPSGFKLIKKFKGKVHHKELRKAFLREWFIYS